MASVQMQARHIVIAVDFEEKDDKAMAFLLDTLWRSGMVIDLVHVVMAREEYNEVYHGAHCACWRQSAECHAGLSRRRHLSHSPYHVLWCCASTRSCAP